MYKSDNIKVNWTWEEWLESRSARKAVTEKYGSAITRRKESSSDKRLRSAFNGNRGPDFNTTIHSK